MKFLHAAMGLLILAALSGCATYYPTYSYANGPTLPDASYPGYYTYQNYPRPLPYEEQGYGYTGMGEQQVQFGRIESIRPLSIPNQRYNQTSGAGAVIGGILGGVVLNQIFKNTGGSRYYNYGRGYRYSYHDNTRDIATLGGAIAGGMIGNSIEKNQTPTFTQGQEIVIQLESGQYISITQNNLGLLRVGQTVRIVGQGARARVYPD